MKKTIGLIVLALTAFGGLAFYFYSRRWQKFDDNNFIGNYDFNRVAFVTDYDTGLAAGDKVEILQDTIRNRKPSYDGEVEVKGVSKVSDTKYLFVVEKPWAGSSPVVPGKWRKLNLF